MSCRALFDVSIFEDVLNKREGEEESLRLLQLVNNGEVDGWISSLTTPLLYLLEVEKKGEKEARQSAGELTSSFAEVPLRRSINVNALINSGFKYDADLQFETALQFGLNTIVTRRKQDYRQGELAIVDPGEFFDLLNKNENGDAEEGAKVPFMDLSAQHHQVFNEIDERFADIIRNTGFILGKHVAEFEKEFAGQQGAEYCIGVSSGTDALHVALMALGIGYGDKVIVPVNTFIATAEAVSLCGAIPVFVDHDEFYNIDCRMVEELFDSGRSDGIKAIIPVHLYGQPAQMDKLSAISQKFGLAMIEDCCQAHLAEWQGKKVGNFGELGAFSFYPGKNLGAYGEAGALITNSTELYDKAMMVRQHGSVKQYHHSLVGHNYRMEAFQGAVLATKIKYLNGWSQKRRDNAQIYSELLIGVGDLILPEERPETLCVYHLYVIQTKHRNELRQFLKENNIITGQHYPVPLHLQEAYGELGGERGDFPVAESTSKRILSLPMFPELTVQQIKYVCDVVKEFFEGIK